MLHDFKYSSVGEYLLQLEKLLKENKKVDEYESMIEEFMEFCEVSGSVK